MTTMLVKKRPLTEEERAMLETKIQAKVDKFRTAKSPTMGSGDYHDGACDNPVFADSPGTTECGPCP